MARSRPTCDAKPRRDYAQEITDRIVGLIESGETLPWRKPWITGGGDAPRRVTGEAYRGINSFWLSLLGCSLGYASPYWMTFRQAKELGGSVRKGETSALVVYYGVGKTEGTDAANVTEAGEEGGHYRFLKGYAVFNVAQIDGLPDRFHPALAGEDTGARPIAEIEAFFARLPVPIVSGGEVAAYVPSRDQIIMPDISRFETASRFYATALHEMAHASGTPSRLNRDTEANYHKDIAIRAEEELVAEIASAIGGPRLGLPIDHTDDHAAYVGSWLRKLQSDKRHIFRAAAEAQRAVDWIFTAAGEALAEPDDAMLAA